MTERSATESGRDSSASRKRPSPSSYNHVYVHSKPGRLLVAADEGLFFQPDVSANHPDQRSSMLLIGWSQLQTITANLATSSTALLKLTTNSNTKKVVVKFASRSQLEKARRDIQDGWKQWRKNTDRIISILDPSDHDFSESHRSGGDAATLANHPTSPLDASVKTAGVASVASKRNVPSPLFDHTTTTTTNTTNNDDHPMFQVLPHNQIVLPRPQSQLQQSNPPGHYVLDFSEVEETQHIQVTLVGHDFQEQNKNRVVSNSSYRLSLNPPLNQKEGNENSGNKNGAPPYVQPYDNDLETALPKRPKVLAPTAANNTVLANNNNNNNNNDDLVVEGYHISKQQCMGITTVTVVCICVLLVTTVVLVILLWSNNNNSGTENYNSVFRNDDFYAGVNNNYNDNN